MPTPPAPDINGRFALARDLWQRGRSDEAERILRSLAVHTARHAEVAFLRAEIARGAGQLTAAARLILDMCRKRRFDRRTSLRGVRFIRECERHDLAGQLCDAALKGNTDVKLLALAGDIARESGDFARAAGFYRRALAAGVSLDESFVLSALAQITRYTDRSHPDFERLDRHRQDAAFTRRSRASAGFGLAKAYEDVDDIASAAAALRQANMLVRAVTPWHSQTWARFVEAQMRARVAHSGLLETAFVPIFVVGLPRSGTTLTATLLGGQSGVRNRGELRVLPYIASRLIEGGYLGDARVIGEAARLYFAQVRQDDEPATWYVDKNPLNFRYLHIVSAMFPLARIIHCRRSRRDNSLSLWGQDFAHPDLGFAYDFSDIADFAAGYDLLMRHWRQTLPIPIYDLEYETLVADPERILRELRDFIGVPSAASRHGSAPLCTPITSSSYWQARQPIYATSVGRWRRYLPFVPELADITEPSSESPESKGEPSVVAYGSGRSSH